MFVNFCCYGFVPISTCFLIRSCHCSLGSHTRLSRGPSPCCPLHWWDTSAPSTPKPGNENEESACACLCHSNRVMYVHRCTSIHSECMDRSFSPHRPSNSTIYKLYSSLDVTDLMYWSTKRGVPSTRISSWSVPRLHGQVVEGTVVLLSEIHGMKRKIVGDNSHVSKYVCLVFVEKNRNTMRTLVTSPLIDPSIGCLLDRWNRFNPSGATHTACH